MDTMQLVESLWLFAAFFSTLVTAIRVSFQFAMQDAQCGTPRQKSTIDVIIHARNNVTIGEYDGMLCGRQNGTDRIYTKDCKKYEKLGKFYSFPLPLPLPNLRKNSHYSISVAEHQGSTEA